jgi:hypothetical protein
VGEPAGGVGAGVPGIDVGLSACTQAAAAFVKPGQQRGGLKNLVSALCGLFLGGRSVFGELT